MRLAALIESAELIPRQVVGDATVEVTGVAHDSRTVTARTLFCCVRGSRVDGHDLAAAAAAAGAVGVVVDHLLDLEAPLAQVVVDDVRAAMGVLAAAAAGHPSRDLVLVGVTGTNGKTTTVTLLRAILEAAGHRAEVIGTLTSATVASAPPTTPDAPELQALLAAHRDDGVTAVAMEVSSHGLAMRRVDGCRFRVGVFTNLSHDHLDVHATMEAYFAAKARLLTPELTDRAVVGLDDPHGRLLADAAMLPTTGFSLADAEDLELSAAGSRFRWRGQAVALRLAGRHNVANALAAATAAAELGIDPVTVAAGLAAAPVIAGRFEPVEAGQSFSLVVDYAHTPDGLEHVLSAARELVGGASPAPGGPAGRVIVVFGAGGDRDPAKRPLMGAVAARMADLAVVTSDNPRSEVPEAIIGAIVAGVEDHHRDRVQVEPDRKAAIAAAVAAAVAGDLVVVAGKGHETTQTFADRVVVHDDRVVAAAALAALARVRGADGAPDDGATPVPTSEDGHP